MRAYIIVDLGFGDSGKGLLTDFLVRHFDAQVVVRYNGGAQAGHNVVTPDGRHHTFSQFGAGTFLPHVKTYLSRHMVVHPSALLVEGDLLAGKGVWDPFSRLRLSDQALVITPFHQATNRIRELARGQSRHGSCGVGVGETVEDSRSHPENRVLAGDLNHPATLRRKLSAVRDRKFQEISELCRDHSRDSRIVRELGVFQDENLIDRWISSITRIHELGLVVPDSVLEDWLQGTGNAVFEGAQGILLDADAGFHPFTTWSRCTAIHAMDLVHELAPQASPFQIGVLRAYAVRHGAGPLPTETDSLGPVISEHNVQNEWQGAVRYGWFDAVLANYALSITGGIDALAITHLDVLSRLGTWKCCVGYENFQTFMNPSFATDRSDRYMTSFRLPESLSLDKRTELTQALTAVKPAFKTSIPDEATVLSEIESLLGQPVGLISRGPTAPDVQIRNMFPG